MKNILPKSSNSKVYASSEGIVHLGGIAAVGIAAIVAAAGVYIYSRSDLRGDPVARENRKIRDEIENAPKGCCIPFCTEDVTELECERVHGGRDWIAESCSDLEECNKGCCLPHCKDITKVECSGYGEGEDSGFGYGDSEFVDSACSILDECTMGCCELDSVYFDELKMPCTSVGGGWSPERCEEEEDDGQYTVHFNDDSIKGTMSDGMSIEMGFSNAWAQTCDGLYGRWEGTAHQRTVLKTSAGEDIREGEGEFDFVVNEGDGKIGSNKRTLTLKHRMNCPYCEDPWLYLEGTISKGATGCN